MIPIIQDIDYVGGELTLIHKENKHIPKKEMIYTYREVSNTLRKAAEIGNTLLNNIVTEIIQNNKDIQETFKEDCNLINISYRNNYVILENEEKNLFAPRLLEILIERKCTSTFLFVFYGTANAGYEDIHYNHELKKECRKLNVDADKCIDFNTIYSILSNFSALSYDKWYWNIIQEPKNMKTISKIEKDTKSNLGSWKIQPEPLDFIIDIDLDFEPSILDKPVRITSKKELTDKKWKDQYKKLRKLVKKYDYLITDNNKSIESNTRYKLSDNEFFWNGNIRNIFFDKDTISRYDLSNINLNKCDISGLDFSNNKEVNIPFDKIEKRLVETNLENYPMDNITLEHFDLTNANLKGTNASIDLASCIISTPSKGSLGTKFDPNNTFYWGGEKLDIEKVKQLKLNIERVDLNDR